jgi:hypothetical protein
MGGVVEGIHPSARPAEGKIKLNARSDLVNYRTTRSDLGNRSVAGGGGIIIIIVFIVVVVVVSWHDAWLAIVGIVAVGALALHVAQEDHTLSKVHRPRTSATRARTSKHTTSVGGEGEGAHRAVSDFLRADWDALAVG